MYKDDIQVGDIYYSAGPLQRDGIEEWQWKNDKFDIQRAEMNNVFRTAEEAKVMKRYIESFQPSGELLFDNTSGELILE